MGGSRNFLNGVELEILGQRILNNGIQGQSPGRAAGDEVPETKAKYYLN